jgi:tetratricopeptide (TPR) repeat protein
MPMGARRTAFLAAILLCLGATCPRINLLSSQRPEETDVGETTQEAGPPGALDQEEPPPGEPKHRAIAYLEVGREEEARSELTRLLEESPSDWRARDLMLQIDATPEEYFAPAFHGDFSDYELRLGSSLSAVAKECLGDSLKFYALWKLNRENPSIVQPNEIEGATTIRIPGPPCAGDSRPVQPSEKTQAEMLEKIDAAIGSRAYGTALTLIEKAETEYGPVPEVVSRRERACREYAGKTESKNPSRAAALYVCVGDSKRVRAETVDEKLEVLQAFEQAARLDPSGVGPSRLEETRKKLKPEVNRLHTEAHRAMRAGDCETASSLWRTALRIDPSEDRAQAGLSRCRYEGPRTQRPTAPPGAPP